MSQFHFYLFLLYSCGSLVCKLLYFSFHQAFWVNISAVKLRASFWSNCFGMHEQEHFALGNGK